MSIKKALSVANEYSEKPTLTLTVKELPELKEWEVGKKYKILIEVEQVGINKDEYGESGTTGRFKVLKATDYAKYEADEDEQGIMKMPDNAVWNVESLKESVDQRFADNQKAVETALIGQEKAVSAALSAAKEAVVKSDLLTDKRFDSVNETIAKVTGQTLDLMPRAEYVANHKALDDKIDVINSVLNKTSGDKNLFVTTSELDNRLTLVVDRMEATMKPVVEYVTRQQGQSQGSQLTMGKISAIAVAFATLMGIITFVVNQLSK